MKISESPAKNPGIVVAASRNTWKTASCPKTFPPFGEKFASRCRAFLSSLASNILAVIFTTVLSLSGSYLFFIQLAEYGW